jgi:Fe2+ transport system protein FeoA
LSSRVSERFFLSNVRRGRCRIVDLSRCETQRSKLRSIGLIENAVVEVMRGSAEGMLILLIGESRMGLSNSLASKIVVEPVDERVCFVDGGEENNAVKGRFGRRRRYRYRTGW